MAIDPTTSTRQNTEFLLWWMRVNDELAARDMGPMLFGEARPEYDIGRTVEDAVNYQVLSSWTSPKFASA